jgi:hypothetical protein
VALRARPREEDDWPALRSAIESFVAPIYTRNPAGAQALSRLALFTPALSGARLDRAEWRGPLTRALAERHGLAEPVPIGLFHSDHWGPLWDVFEETGVVVSLDFGSGSFVPGFSASAKQLSPASKGGEFRSVSARIGGNADIKDDDAPTAASFAVYATNLMWTASDLVFSGQLQKRPRLKFMLAEGGIGWFPYIWERMDKVWQRHRYYQPIDFDARPSDLFKKHFWGCYIEGEFGIRTATRSASTASASRSTTRTQTATGPTAARGSPRRWPTYSMTRRRIVELNAREVLNFPRP